MIEIELPKLEINLIDAAQRSEGFLGTLDLASLKIVEQRYLRFLALIKKYSPPICSNL
ncbi:hypothetical protein [Bacillus thuringiensis]|uniref:hypothetical protein n=1 Tax=Bacillus thuringiensis TaxID=1428 RepID=UPI001EDE38BF|nr:hypothetical protein [Bacillus thuringiensis]MCG3426775.1 hypothetical protein [Bacillus thuringiensis]